MKGSKDNDNCNCMLQGAFRAEGWSDFSTVTRSYTLNIPMLNHKTANKHGMNVKYP